jgi:hypothetical protein
MSVDTLSLHPNIFSLQVCDEYCMPGFKPAIVFKDASVCPARPLSFPGKIYFIGKL